MGFRFYRSVRLFPGVSVTDATSAEVKRRFQFGEHDDVPMQARSQFPRRICVSPKPDQISLFGGLPPLFHNSRENVHPDRTERWASRYPRHHRPTLAPLNL
jgi:hypothetical protein